MSSAFLSHASPRAPVLRRIAKHHNRRAPRASRGGVGGSGSVLGSRHDCACRKTRTPITAGAERVADPQPPLQATPRDSAENLSQLTTPLAWRFELLSASALRQPARPHHRARCCRARRRWLARRLPVRPAAARPLSAWRTTVYFKAPTLDRSFSPLTADFAHTVLAGRRLAGRMLAGQIID